MSERWRWAIVAAVCAGALGATGIVAVFAWQQHQARAAGPSTALTTSEAPRGERILFRNTAPGAGYGHVAVVPLDDPGGARTVTATVCDRVDAAARRVSCLRTHRGIAPSYSATVYDDAGTELAQWPLPGIPSRTRLSPDGTLVASTSFVTGHSYATTGFSTETVIRDAHGESLGNLEDWAFVVDGAVRAPDDRNFWGVTFADDDDTFYATAGLSRTGETMLVRGSLAQRTLTAIAQGVECPSLSPDGTRIAFKRVTNSAGGTTHWTPAVYDLASGRVTLLAEDRSIDDQIAWLDDTTILYGLPRADAPGDTDVWALRADGSGAPTLFLEHAWSPAVLRQGDIR